MEMLSSLRGDKHEFCFVVLSVLLYVVILDDFGRRKITRTA